jgi:hypothetical protein
MPTTKAPRRASNRRRSYAKTRTAHIRMDDELFLQLELRADRERRSLSEISRKAFEAYLLAPV